MTALLSVQHLRIEYPVRRRSPFSKKPAPLRAIDDVSFQLQAGETLALVGESGSGKSTIGNACLGLVPVTAGSIQFDGAEIANASVAQRRGIAMSMQAIFQNPFGSLNPALTIGQTLTEPLRAVRRMGREESRQVVATLLERVNMPPDAASRYPGNFSGGQRQRIAIARALAVDPKLVVCDEPTSALDVSTQARVLDLLAELRRELGIAYLFITHDLAVVRHFADRVIVLDHGRIVEDGDVVQVCERPQHPYTQRLVMAAPVPDPVMQRRRREERLALLDK